MKSKHVRRIGRGIGACLLGVSALTGCGREADTVTAAHQEQEQAEARNAPAPSDAAASEGAGMARLRQALEGAPLIPMITRAERLEAARAWVDEHGGDFTPRERELQAQLIVVLESLFGEDADSARWAVGIGEFPLFGLYTRDTDGDGVLTEDEAIGSQSRLSDLQTQAMGYFPDLDADGDGTVSETEAQAGFETLNKRMEPMLDRVMELSSRVAWDTNNDGILSEDERAAGLASLPEGTASDDVYLRYSAYESIADPFRDLMLLVPSGDPSERRAALGDRPETPRWDDFDFDGDGSLSEIEQTAYNQEFAAGQPEREAWANRYNAANELASYDEAKARLDTDGDGVIAPAEWDAGFETLRRDRDERVFVYLYDTDGSGRVTDTEVAVFMDAYEQGLPFADADMDGSVGVADLRAYLRFLEAQ